MGVSSSAIQMAGCVSLPGAGSVAHRRFAGVTGSRRRVRPGTFLQVAAAGTGELFAKVIRMVTIASAQLNPALTPASKCSAGKYRQPGIGALPESRWWHRAIQQTKLNVFQYQRQAVFQSDCSASTPLAAGRLPSALRSKKRSASECRLHYRCTRCGRGNLRIQIGQ